VRGIAVPRRGLEPLRPCGQRSLSPPRLPIPPPRRGSWLGDRWAVVAYWRRRGRRAAQRRVRAGIRSAKIRCTHLAAYSEPHYTTFAAAPRTAPSASPCSCAACGRRCTSRGLGDTGSGGRYGLCGGAAPTPSHQSGVMQHPLRGVRLCRPGRNVPFLAEQQQSRRRSVIHNGPRFGPRGDTARRRHALRRHFGRRQLPPL
jgi:hypothetical protein